MSERKPDRVIVQMSFTRNLGNFQSMRVEVGLESDRLDSEKNSDEHFKRVYDWVEKKFLQEFEDTELEVKKKIRED